MTSIDMGRYLPRHDVVHQSPPLEGWEGLPLGNGSLGGMLWASTEGLTLQINHTDMYDAPDPSDPGEGWIVLRSCGRLALRHAVPMHDWLYLNDFEARLSLHDAESTWSARTAFGTFQTRGYVHAERPVAVIEHWASYAGDLAASGAPIRISLERWGSRIFGWWYANIAGGSSQQWGKAEAFIDGADAGLKLSFRGGRAVLRCRVIGAPAQARILHDHQVELGVPAASRQEFALLVACVTSRDSAEPDSAAKSALNEAAAAHHLIEEHRRRWHQFWGRSFVHISPDYFENLYYLHHYLMGSSCRGHFPPQFNGGLWIWNRDVRNWVNPHHWNEQQSFWCLPAAGRADLLKPYLDTYFRLMPEWRAAAQRRGFDGILVCEMHDFFGRPLGEHGASFRDNFTPAAQIALFFWWHYRYSGDIDRLREQGYPFLKAVGGFYLSLLRWVEQRQEYEIPLASTYEDERPLRFTNSITNLAMIRAVFPILLQASELLDADAPTRERWRHVLEHLPPYRLNDRDRERGVTLASGLVNGKELPEKEDHNHGPLFCPVFPAGDLGLKDRGTALFEAERHTLATYPAGTNAITPTVAIAARLGMAEEAERRLSTIVRNLQQFPNGLFFNIDHWHMHSRRAPAQGASGEFAAYQRDYLEDRGCRLKNVRITASERDGVAEHQTDLPMAPFSQMGMETLGHFTAGLQEMLLQSHEGAIRVFPAVPDDWEAAFTLYGEGGFRVTSRRAAQQEPAFIEIVSERGGRCAVALPRWDTAAVFDGVREVTVEVEDRCIRFDTEPGHCYVLTPKAQPPSTKLQFESVRNATPKRYFEAMIGKPHDF